VEGDVSGGGLEFSLMTQGGLDFRRQGLAKHPEKRRSVLGLRWCGHDAHPGKSRPSPKRVRKGSGLFEARKPRETAVISEIDGVVKFGEVAKGQRKI
jgi:hypothetical protein